MDSGRDVPTALHRRGRRLYDRLPAVVRDREPVVLGVALVTLFALALRLYHLGYRVDHWDEARVAYWILRYQQTGAYAYNPWIHGPFIQHATSPLFALFGPSDFVSRLPVALVGGLFPLSALLFRKHLRDYETVIFSFLLASNSILLYYSRFLRSDVLVAAFMMTALGFLVRTYDTREGRYLYPAALFLGFGIASKENSLIYVLTWVGASALLLDMGLFRPRSASSGTALIWEQVTAVFDRVRTRDRELALFVVHVIGAAIFLFVVWLVMFAPRGDVIAQQPWPATRKNLGTVTLGDALSHPLKFPKLVTNTWDYWLQQYPTWSDKALKTGKNKSLFDHYEKFAPKYFHVLKDYALATMLFSIIGFLRERYAATDSRNLVLFCSYAGFASVLGYPLGLDIFGPWNALHPVVVLALPAAVALGVVYRWGREATVDRDAIQATLATALLLVVVGNVLLTAVGAAYVNDTNADKNDLIQYGQPRDDMRYDLGRLNRIAAKNQGVDVLVYGDSFVSDNHDSHFKPSCLDWFDSLPMSWYLYASDANVTCIKSSANLSSIAGDVPPIVLTRKRSVSDLQPYVEGYEYTVYRLRTFGTKTALLFNESAIDRG